MPGKIGINIAWFKYDEDFGKAGTRPPPWVSQIDAELANLKSIGIEVIRWWLLGDGGNYPPWPTAITQQLPFFPPQILDWAVGTPSRLPDMFLDDFRLMLTKVAQAGLQVIPCLLDYFFLMGKDSDPFKGKRWGYLTDDARSSLLLHNVLEPLVKIVGNEGCTTSRGWVPFKDVVFAFEVMNEPEWCTDTWSPLGPRVREPNVPYDKMVSFLRRGCQIINSNNVKSTVGFANTSTMFHDTSVPASIRQFHCYANFFSRDLFAMSGPDTQGVIVGEVADDTEPDRYTAGDAALDMTGRLVRLLLGGAAAVLVWPSRKQKLFGNEGLPYRTLTDYEKQQIKHASETISGKS
jgi:hypothetical protein